MDRLANREVVVTPPIAKQWQNDVTAPPETTIVLVSRDKKKHKALESAKRDIRARCVTCICLILTCALCLGVVSIVLMMKTNSGLLGEQASNFGRTEMEQVDYAAFVTTNAILHDDSAILHDDSVISHNDSAILPDDSAILHDDSTNLTTADSEQAMTIASGDSMRTAARTFDDSAPAGSIDSRKTTISELPVTGGDSTNSWRTAAGDNTLKKGSLRYPSPGTSPILATPRFTTQKMTPTDSPATRCVQISQSFPSCHVLPYVTTTEEASQTARHVIDAFFFDPKDKCHPDWIFFICAYMLPECKTVLPSSDWKPRCLCPDFNAKIFSVRRCAGRELGKKGVEQERLTCDGRAEPVEPNCLKP